MRCTRRRNANIPCNINNIFQYCFDAIATTFNLRSTTQHVRTQSENNFPVPSSFKSIDSFPKQFLLNFKGVGGKEVGP
jgi:hypothetical protein